MKKEIFEYIRDNNRIDMVDICGKFGHVSLDIVGELLKEGSIAREYFGINGYYKVQTHGYEGRGRAKNGN